MPRFFPHRVVRRIGDSGADLSQLAHHGAVAHDLRIAPDVGGRGRVLRQRAQVCQPAGALELPGALQAFRHGNDISRPGIADQLGDVPVDEPMIGAVEIRFADHVGNLVPGRIVEQQPAEHRLLCLHRMRRQFDELDLSVGDADALCCKLRHEV